MPMKLSIKILALVTLSLWLNAAAWSHPYHTVSGTDAEPTPEQWIDWGQRVHGGFGVLIAAGIRIGLDAQSHLNATRRQMRVTFYDSDIAPCPCLADGIIVAVSASPGQRTLIMSDEKAGEGWYAEILFEHRSSGEQVRYCVRPEAMFAFNEVQRQPDFRLRFDAVMGVDFSEIAERSPDPMRCPDP